MRTAELVLTSRGENTVTSEAMSEGFLQQREVKDGDSQRISGCS
jgi:hypothetical protein